MFGIRRTPRGVIVLCGRVTAKSTRITSGVAAAEASTKRSVPSNYNSSLNPRNLSLVGPPGSGKGSYGRHFAEALGVPLVTVSDLLRTLRPDLTAQLSEGKLVDDAIVGATVRERLSKLRNGYVLDGFPRTLKQVSLAEETWPDELRVSSVIHLAVPDFACESKLLGRRSCSRCGRSYNVHGVHNDPWILPPVLPDPGAPCSGNGIEHEDEDEHNHERNGNGCDATVSRDDDTPEIVRERLRTYHRHADPILERFRDRGKLLTLTPNRGFDDLPGLVELVRSHVGE